MNKIISFRFKILIGFILIPLQHIVAMELTADPEKLPVHKAFKTSVSTTNESINITWEIAPEYYLIDSSLKLEVLNQNKAIVLSEPLIFPKDELIDSDGKNIHKLFTKMIYPYSKSSPGEITIRASFIGCHSDGECYPKSEIVQAILIP